MTYKKNLLYTILAFLCLVLFLATFIYCLPRLPLLSSDAMVATVNSPDKDGSSGYAVLKLNIPREDGGTVFFHYYYPGSSSHLKKNTEVLVAGNIVFMDESTDSGVNAGLVIGTEPPLIVCLVLSILSAIGAIILVPLVFRNYIHKPWNAGEEKETKAKTINFLYTTEIFAIVIASILFVIGIMQAVGYLRMENHTAGIITYESSLQSSQFVKKYNGNKLYNLKSVYGKGIRPNYKVLQIKVDSPIDGAEEFWYEGNNIVIGSKKVYVGYNGEGISVLSQTEMMMALISVLFLIIHAISALIISKKNKYGGKIFWFFKF